MPPLVVPALGALFYFVILPEGNLGKSAYTGTKLFTLIYPFLFLRHIGLGGIIRRRRHDPAAQWPRWRVVMFTGLATGLAIAGVGFLLMETPLGDVVREGADRVSSKAEGLGFKDHFVLFAVFVSVIHSGVEEFYWRWFAYGQLRRKVAPLGRPPGCRGGIRGAPLDYYASVLPRRAGILPDRLRGGWGRDLVHHV